MGGNMIEAHRVYDAGVIKSIMTDPALWSTVAEDGQSIEDYSPDTEGQCWLLMVDGENIAGVYNVHGVNAITCEIHAQVLPDYREEYSYDTGRAALQWIYDNEPGYLKVIAQIPTIYENVKNFTCQFGFQVEGINRLSYQKNGEAVDQWLLGITREEIGVVLNG